MRWRCTANSVFRRSLRIGPIRLPGRCTWNCSYRFTTRHYRSSHSAIIFAGENIVIARIWHGYTKPEHADVYQSMLKPQLLSGISKAEGYKGSYLLRREVGDEVEFITVILWDSIDAI